MTVVLRNARIVTTEGVVTGSITATGDQITGIGGPDPAGPVSSEDLHGGWLVPGFVDIHVHGGGGATYTTGDPDQARAAADFHLRHGTTTTLASLVTSPPDLLRAATVRLAPLVAEGMLAGIHYEGPYLSTVRCGAQNPEHLRAPDIAELSALLDAAPGAVRMVTIAPELPNAITAIEWLAARGVIVAIGHTDATYQQTLAGVAAGASVGTHVFNGMRQPHHREPGPVYALLGSPHVVCELIADGVHLHAGTLRFATGVTGPDRATLITDAMAAAGMADGEYELGDQPVTVADGVARLAGSGAIAGSTLTMDAALRHAVAAGVSMLDAVTMAATTPAGILGLTDRGVIAPGKRADLVVLDDDLRVRKVMRAGRWTDDA
jgi:N-acetylglucosamine-6-phosphate deacetylase